MRTPLIVANWKMHGSIAKVQRFIPKLLQVTDWQVELVICPPYPYLGITQQLIGGAPIYTGGQNVFSKPEGAYTGEVSADMLRDMGCSYVIIGHSERRQYFAESDQDVVDKCKLSIQHNLRPIVCVGESLQQRESGKTLAVIEQQVKAVLENLTLDQSQQLIWAYEPVWAIGTGKTASAEDAQQVHYSIRKWLQAVDSNMAAKVRILYGGSVKPANAESLFAQADVDGGLIGGASLEAESFVEIAKTATSK